MRFKTENQILTMFSYTSMTDIVMLLLIFFLISSSFVTQPGIKVQLPKAETGETAAEGQIIVTLTEKGRIFVNSEQVTPDILGQKLSGLLGGTEKRVVVIRADRGVTLQNTVQVIDIAKAVGAERFMIATVPLGAQ
jgi:biopolymer transport protein ExbD